MTFDFSIKTKTDSDPQLQNNLAEFRKMISAEIIGLCHVKQKISIDCLNWQKTGWFWTLFRDIWTLIGKKNRQTNKQHLGSLPFAGAHNSERATSMYSWEGVFTGQFIFRTVLAEFRISFKSHKPVSKTYRPKNDNFCVLMTLPVFLFEILFFECVHRLGRGFIFAGKLP